MEQIALIMSNTLSRCAGPQVETAQNWKRVRSSHFCVSPKLETAAVSTFGLDPKVET